MIFLGWVSIESAILPANVSPLFVNLLRAALTRERDAVCGSYCFVKHGEEVDVSSGFSVHFPNSSSSLPLLSTSLSVSLFLSRCLPRLHGPLWLLARHLSLPSFPTSPPGDGNLACRQCKHYILDKKKQQHTHSNDEFCAAEERQSSSKRYAAFALLKACRLFFRQMSWLVWQRVWCQPP